jgi:hypothetical protein
MQSIPHTLAGITSIVICSKYPVLGAFVATGSHALLDMVNESGFKMKDNIIFDMIPTIMCFLVSIYTQNFWVFFKGWAFGNLFDLYDKKMYLTMFFPNKFKRTERFHWGKPCINPHVNVTKLIGIVSMILIALILYKV